MGYVYILISLKNGRYYIGSTNNLKRRFEEHTNGKSDYTKNLRPLKLVFSQQYEDLLQVRRIERMLKKFKNKVILDKIIKDGFIKAGVIQQ